MSSIVYVFCLVFVSSCAYCACPYYVCMCMYVCVIAYSFNRVYFSVSSCKMQHKCTFWIYMTSYSCPHTPSMDVMRAHVYNRPKLHLFTGLRAFKCTLLVTPFHLYRRASRHMRDPSMTDYSLPHRFWRRSNVFSIQTESAYDMLEFHTRRLWIAHRGNVVLQTIWYTH